MASVKFQEKYPNGVTIYGDGKLNGNVVIGEDHVVYRPDGYVDPDLVAPEGYEGEMVELNGIRGFKLSKSGNRKGCAHLYIHEGGFTIYGLSDFLNKDPLDTMIPFMNQTDMDSFAVDYRTPPIAKFPASVDDCYQFYLGLLDQGYDRIVVGGESAGAGLTLSLALKLKDEGKPLPVCLWVSSPVGDIYFDPSDEMCANVYHAYAGNEDHKNPYLSPVYGDMNGLPPIFFAVGSADNLAEGTMRLVDKATADDVDVVLHYGKGMPHCWPSMDAGYPEAEFVFRSITDFVNHFFDLDEK